MKYKVLFITRSLSDGGAAVAIDRYLSAINSKEDIDIDVIEGVGGFEWYRKIVYFVYKFLNLYLYRTNLFGSTITLGLFSTIPIKIRYNRYDVVHINWVGLDFMTLHSLSKIQTKIVWTIHDEHILDGILHFPRDGKLLGSSWLRRRHDNALNSVINRNNITFVFPSEFLKSKFQRKHPEAKVLHIPNPIPNASASTVLHSDRYVMKNIVVGGYSIFSDDRKGFDLLSAALEQSDILTNHQLHVFGEKAPTTLLQHKYYPHGVLDRAGVQKLLSNAKFVVVPSKGENFPSIILEAMSLGIPVIATNVGGIPEMIQHGVTGFLSDPKVSYLSSCLTKATKISSSDYVKMSQAAKQFVNTHYSYDRVMEHYFKAYTTQ